MTASRFSAENNADIMLKIGNDRDLKNELMDVEQWKCTQMLCAVTMSEEAFKRKSRWSGHCESMCLHCLLYWNKNCSPRHLFDSRKCQPSMWKERVLYEGQADSYGKRKIKFVRKIVNIFGDRVKKWFSRRAKILNTVKNVSHQP